MRKQEVIERLCALVTEVADKNFRDDNLAHDCFCHQSLWPGDDSCVAEKIIKFIEDAVRKEINNQMRDRFTSSIPAQGNQWPDKEYDKGDM